jgi:hypothetical protein
MYDGALADAGLTTDPFTGSRYAFGGGNPISNIELDGHSSCPPPTINCGGTSPSSYIDLPAGQQTQQQMSAMGDIAASALNGVFKKNAIDQRMAQSTSGGSAICQGLVDLCSLPSAIANIPSLPSELKQFGSSWLAGWRAGWGNTPVSWTQGKNLNVTMPSGTVLQFGSISGASGGMIPNTSKPIFGDYADFGQASLYMINDPTSGQILKFGITNDPAGRYSQKDFNSWNAEYGGNFQMDILHNFDTRDDAISAERYLTQRVGGPENFEDWANTVPNDAPWDQVLKEALSKLDPADMG